MDTMLVINALPEAEDELIDYLMELDFISGFTLFEVRGFGRHEKMTLAEQVSGRRKRIQIEMLLNAERVSHVVDNLASRVGKDIVYWEHPVRNFARASIDWLLQS